MAIRQCQSTEGNEHKELY